MGSLAGHLIPGIFFIIHGLWWCYSSLWYHLKSHSSLKISGDSRAKREKHFQSATSSFFEFKRDSRLSRKSWFPLPCNRFPLEPIIKIVLPALGIVVEAFFNYRRDEEGNTHLVMEVYKLRDSNGEFNNLSKLHHITMYSSFMLSGIVDCLVLGVRFPHPTSTLFFTIAFIVEASLFYLHTVGRDVLNVVIHSILVYSIISCAIFSAIRVVTASNLIINLGLGSSILLQGTWFVQAGYFLYGGFLDHRNAVNERGSESHEEMELHMYVMFVLACFSWHILLIAFGNMLLWILLSVYTQSRLIHKRSSKRRVLVPGGLRQTWHDKPDENNKLIVDEFDESTEENGMEMQLMKETQT